MRSVVSARQINFMKAWLLLVVVCTASSPVLTNEPNRVELMSRLGFEVLPALATRRKK